MEVIAAGFVFSLFVWFIQKKERAKIFPTGLCIFCGEPARVGRDGLYVHTATGQRRAETPSGVGGPFPNANIPSSPEEQAMYQS